MTVLQGTRVIELSSDVAGAFTGRLLAAYGADVVLVEPPGGHAIRGLPPHRGEGPDASVFAAYLHAGKRSVVLDLADAPARRALQRLLLSADVVIDSLPVGELASAGVDLEALQESRPAAIVCSISPFGRTGPRAAWRATALTAAASGGQLELCGDRDAPPLKTAGHQAHYQGGLDAFSATLTALFAARETGTGDVIDISLQEIQAAKLEGVGPGALTRGSEGSRTGNQTFTQWGIHACADGHVGVAAMPRQTGAVYDCIGHPEFKDDPEVGNGWTLAGNELMAALLPAWIAERTAAEIFQLATRSRAPFALIPTPRELLTWPGLTETGFWRWVEHPVIGRHPLPVGPIEIDGADRGDHRRAPLVGEHTSEVLAEGAEAPLGGEDAAREDAAPANAPPLPYAGLRVIDMTQVWAGPYGTRFLGDMGADVIKVEGPRFPDAIRTMGGATQAPDINLSAYFNEYNRSKRGITLDLQQEAGRGALIRLVRSADIFVENWSSGVAGRLGLSYEALRALNPGLIYVSMPGFGHSGPDRDRVGYGPNIEQMGGLVALQGYEGGPPHKSGISYGDPIAGTTAAGAVALALLRRQSTGAGCHMTVNQRDGIVGFVGEYVIAESLGVPLPVQIGSRDPLFAPHDVYRAADGAPRAVLGREGQLMREISERWIAIAIDSDDAWRSFRTVLGDPRLDDPVFDLVEGRRAAREAIDVAITEWTSARDADEAAALLQAAGVAACPVLSPLLLTTDPHMLAREAFIEYEHPDAGRHRSMAPTWRMRRRPVTAIRAAPQFAQHSREVLTTLAGYGEEEFSRLLEAGVTSEDLPPV